MPTNTKLLTQAEVKATFGGVTDMTIWRWLNSPEMQFPKPLKIKTRNYWRSKDVDGWLDQQQGGAQ